MTNKSMVISDTKAGLTMAIAVAKSELTVFSPMEPKPLVSPNGYFTRKKLLKKLESFGNGAMIINGLVDSMRASSPTCKARENEDQNSWTVSIQITLMLYILTFRFSINLVSFPHG